MNTASAWRILLRSLGAIIIVLALPLMLTLYEVMDSIEQVKREQQSQQISARLSDLRLLMHRAESEQRSYFMSGNPLFLGKRNSALTELNLTFDRLQNLTADNAEQLQRIKELQQAVNKQIEILRKSLAIYEVEGRKAAQPVLKIGRQERQAAINKITAETRKADRKLLHSRKLAGFPQANIHQPASLIWLATSTIFLSRLFFGRSWVFGRGGFFGALSIFGAGWVKARAGIRLSWKNTVWTPISYAKFLTMCAGKQRISQPYNKLSLPGSIEPARLASP